MKLSLIYLALLSLAGSPVPADAERATPVPDADLPPAVLEAAEALEKIAAEAKYSADPREPAAKVAAVMAAYFRTAD